MIARHWMWLSFFPLMVLSGGCIVYDQLITLTINPDGSGQFVVFRSNIRSTRQGQEAEADILDYRASFNNRTQKEFKRIQESGARIESTSWIRETVPLANLVDVAIPDAAALERLASLKDEHGNVLVKARFTASQTRRRLSLQIAHDPDRLPPAPSDQDSLEKHQLARASNISDFRVAVTSGIITEARGFTIAGDNRSALLDPGSIVALVRAGNGTAECYLKWEVID